MEPVDAVKLVYQSAFGCGHLLSEDCAGRVKAELAHVAACGDVPALTPIGGGICRLNLAAPAVRELPPERIADMMRVTMAQPMGGEAAMAAGLEALRELAPYAEQAGVTLLVETNGVYTNTARLRELLEQVAQDAWSRLLFPSLEREIRGDLTDMADEQAIHTFALNLRPLLMQPPVKNQVVLGFDPAYRTGCKLAVVDATGRVLDTVVIYPTAPQNKVREAKEVLKKLIRKYHVTLISLGNGTASRESEQVITTLCGF